MRPDAADNKNVEQLCPEMHRKVKEGKCPFCGREVSEDDFSDTLSLKEYKRPGLCQKCQDDFFD